MIRLFDIFGKIWALPNTLVGLVVGVIGLAFGGSVRLGHNAIVFFNFPLGPGGALTLGNVILTTEPTLDMHVWSYAARRVLPPDNRAPACDLVHLGKHEEAHTYQYQVLGPAFWLVYWIAGIGRQVSALERAADRYGQIGTDWWPWSILKWRRRAGGV